MSTGITRRQFTFGAAALGAGLVTRTASLRAAGANERINLGIIGVGNRGDALMKYFMTDKRANFIGVCDVYEPYLEAAKAKAGGTAATYGDYRKLLDNKDIDAVIIATPDHWHALQCIDACNAGKDVYVEKPLTLVVGEGRKMIEAAERNKRVAMMGTQRRSTPYIQQAVEAVHSGEIGHVTLVRCFYLNTLFPMGIGNTPDCDPPKGLDWDMWLGPAPRVPYNPNRCLYKFRWFRAYSGGQLTNFGTHWIDVIQPAIGHDAPIAVTAIGGKYAVQDNRDIPDTMEVIWEYPGGTMVTFTQIDTNNAAGCARDADIEFRGTKGTLYVTGSGFEIVPVNNRKEPSPVLDPLQREKVAEAMRNAGPVIQPRKVEKQKTRDDLHAKNFLDCVQSRKPTNCPLEVGHKSTTASLLGNLAYDRKRRLEWDAKAERVTNDDQANDLLMYAYREPWKLA